MKNIKAAKRYAKSLLDLAVETNKLEEVYKDMTDVSNTVKGSRELRLLLQSPIIKPDAKAKVLGEIFSSQVSDLTKSFINIVTEKGREGVLEGIGDAFILQYKAHKNLAIAEVITASPLDAETKVKVDEVIGKIANSEAEIKETVKPEIIGGFIVKVGDKMIDASVASKLKELKREFTENQYIPGF